MKLNTKYEVMVQYSLKHTLKENRENYEVEREKLMVYKYQRSIYTKTWRWAYQIFLPLASFLQQLQTV